jgi:putative polyhydroxyalkanoic acid system protein
VAPTRLGRVRGTVFSLGEERRRFERGIASCRAQPVSLRGTLVRMPPPIAVSIPHQLGRAEARRRIENGFAKIVRLLPGSTGTASEHWEGDRLRFAVAAMGQTVTGVIDVLDAVVTMEIELPGVLGVIAGAFKDRLRKTGQLLLTKE